jgi:hypothetical protein
MPQEPNVDPTNRARELRMPKYNVSLMVRAFAAQLESLVIPRGISLPNIERSMHTPTGRIREWGAER